MSRRASPDAASRWPRREALWPWLLFAAGLVAAWLLRTVDLPVKPLHSDEGVNGWFSIRLFWPEGMLERYETGFYQYRDSDYHGPMLYYVNWLSFSLLGVSDVSLRLGTAVTGVLAVGAVALTRRTLGVVAMACAAALLAVQPADVFFSRTVIHEIYLVAGTVVFVGAGMRWLRAGGYGWACLSALGLAVMFTNKETAILSLAVVGASLTVVWALLPWLREGAGESMWPAETHHGVLRALGDRWRELLAGFGLFWAVMVLFYSSFFTYWEGVLGIVTTYGYWSEYGVTGRNQGKEFGYWLEFAPYVWPALIAGLPELLVGLIRRERTTIFLGLWFGLSFLIYSAIPYKTPWCVLNITLPLALLAGHGVARLTRALARYGPLAAAAPLAWIGMLVALGIASADQNLRRYDDNDLPYVYVQTERGYMGMVELMLELDEQGGHGGQLYVVSLDGKNPMRWYLYNEGWNPDHFKYYRGDPRGKDDWEEWRDRADLFVVRSDQRQRLERELGPGWVQNTFPLRPGFQVTLFVPVHLWDPLFPETTRN